MRKVWKWIWFSIRSFLIFIVLGCTITASVKNIMKTVMVNDFKSKGVLQEDISTDKLKFYKVSAPDEKSSYLTYTNSSGSTIIYPGNEGDILCTFEGAFGDNILNTFIEVTAGGHAAIVTGNYGDYEVSSNIYSSVEATGMNPGDNKSEAISRRYWTINSTYKEVIGLRVNMTDEERKELLSAAMSLIGDPYNFSFIFNTHKYSYCSDLVSKAYDRIGVNLNKDSLSTSVYDLLVSKETYISYYQFRDSKGVNHIYYFG